MEISGVAGVEVETKAVVPDKVEEMGKDAFLKLLVAQLQNQDPLDPMENGEFVAQLAQFSSLEGIKNLGVSVDGMAANMTSMQNLSTSSLIGRYVLVDGNGFELSEDVAVTIGYSIEENAAKVKISIYDELGRQVRQVELGKTEFGQHALVWDGTADDGALMPPGRYNFNVTAENAEGDGLEVAKYATGIVKSVSFDNGAAMISVGGRLITQDNIKEIY
jgi:flagellar basal-body rod modification protein FlgD